MDADRRAELLERYSRGPAEVRAALDGITEAELDRVPADGGWSPRMVVHHLADSELTSAVRLRRVLAEDGPTIQGYDEALFARRLHYERPTRTSLVALEAARASCAELLESLDAEEWTRTATHSEAGPYGVETWLSVYADHCHDHADQIRRARDHGSGTAAGR